MKTLAVHLHLYYLNQLSEILEYLKSLNGQSYDLFVTMVEQNVEAEKSIKSFKPDANVMIVPNQGYDVGPFIEFLHKIDLDQYEYVLKIHTKKNASEDYIVLNRCPMDGKLWKKVLFDSLLKNRKRVESNLAFLDKNPRVGMLSSKYCITGEKITWQHLLPGINRALTDCGFDKTDKVSFVAGTMFYMRAKLLRPFLRYSLKDFSPTQSTVKDGTLAHILERLFGLVVTAQGYTLHGIKHDNYSGLFIVVALKRFLYRKKQTQHRMLIKVCKLPVYFKKIIKNQ